MFNNQSIYHIELHVLDKMEMNELLAHGMCEDRTGPQHSFQAASETTGVWNSSDVDERNIRINADSVRKKTTFTRQ